MASLLVRAVDGILGTHRDNLVLESTGQPPCGTYRPAWARFLHGYWRSVSAESMSHMVRSM